MRWLAAVALWTAGCHSASPISDAQLVSLQALADEVDGGRLMTSIEQLVTAHEHDTPIECDAELASLSTRFCFLTNGAARLYLVQQLEGLGFTVHQDRVDEGKWTSINLVAEHPGRDPQLPAVIVAAHYDAFYAGADDNSSGVAGVLELARLLRGRLFERTIRFIFFDLEEVGLIGSSRYVHDNAVDESIRAVVVLESIGYADPRPGSQRAPTGFPAPSEGDFIAAIGNDLSEKLVVQLNALNRALGIMKVSGVVAPDDGAFPMTGSLLRSDHAPFWLAQKPAFFLTDTADFRNPNYHRVTDTPDTLDPEFLRQVVRLSAVSVAYWAEEVR